MKLRTLIENKERFLVYDIPTIAGDYYKRENKATRKKDLKSKDYKDFVKMVAKLGDDKWDEDSIIDFLYSKNSVIYWDSKRGDYNYSNVKTFDPSADKEDWNNTFKGLTPITQDNFLK